MTDLKFNFVYDRKHVATREKEGVLEIRFTSKGQQKYFSTGIKLKKSQWKDGKVVARPDANVLNQRISILTEKAYSIVTSAYKDDFEFSNITLLFKGETKNVDFPTYCEQRTERRKVVESTKGRYRVFTRFLRSWGGIKSFSDVTVAKVRAMDEYLHGRYLCQTTIYNYHKYLKLFINDAVIDGYIQNNPYKRLPFKISRGDKQYVDCLTMEQFNLIRDVQPTNEHLTKAKDLFLFQCYTGLAYSDLMAFDFKECELVEGKYFYHDKRVKTSVDFVLQLLPQALDILAKYEYVLPRLSNQKYNDYLKVIGSMIGVSNLHSHMGRATAATMFLSKGMALNVVSRVLGHTNIKQTQRYARTLSRDVRTAFDMLETKI